MNGTSEMDLDTEKGRYIIAFVFMKGLPLFVLFTENV